jgi:tyrosinase
MRDAILDSTGYTVTGDDEFALPYWDWSEDGQATPANQPRLALWSLVGPARGQVTQGAVGQLRMRLYENPQDGRLYVGPPRPIWRDAARGAPTLPDRKDRAWTLADGLYDVPSWDESADSFRNKLEGWQDPTEDQTPRRGPWMHNRVHVWVGGEMGPGTSPNDRCSG